MLSFLLQRFVYMLVILIAVSVVGFILIQLPPGDFLTSYIIQLEASGHTVDEAQITSLRQRYGLGLPFHVQYVRWVGNMLRGDFGMSFRWNRPVRELIGERLALTVVISLISLVFTYLAAVSFGLFSATRQYSLGDYLLTFLSFIGLATPNFLFALVLMFIFYRYLGMNVVGLFSPEYVDAPWTLAKVIDMVKHLPIPIIVISTGGIAGLFRVMRGCLLDELDKQYVTAIRAKGVAERRLLLKYPTRIALNPVVSNMGWMFREIVSGGAVIAIVLGLPTVGPLLLQSLRTQDMYLAGTLIVFLCFMTVLGTFVSDLLLLWLDPRIRMK